MNGCIFYYIVIATRFSIGSHPKLAVWEIRLKVISPHGKLCVDYGFYPIFFFTKRNEIPQSNLQWGHTLYSRPYLNIHYWQNVTFFKVQGVLEALKLLSGILIGAVVVVWPHYKTNLFCLLVVPLIPNVLANTSTGPKNHEFDRVLGLLLGFDLRPIDVSIILWDIDSKSKSFWHRWGFHNWRFPRTRRYDHEQHCCCKQNKSFHYELFFSSDPCCRFTHYWVI